MDWTGTVFDVIDMRSFSSLWFWIALAVTWSWTSHNILGVPFDMVGRAARQGGQAQRDLEELVRIRSGRLVHFADASGVWMVALGAAALSGLFVLGAGYGVEFAQAVFLILLPLSVVGILSVRCARQIRASDLRGADLRRRLARHRMTVQAVGMVAIFFTAMWGMYRNMAVGPLG